MTRLVPPVDVVAPADAAVRRVLSDVLPVQALAFLADLHRSFEPERRKRLAERRRRHLHGSTGDAPGFLPETEDLRRSNWTVRPPPPDLLDRRVEITGPTDRKMMVNAFNSGAKVFMADFEDSLSPTWANVVLGQANLRDATRGQLEFRGPERTYRVGNQPAVLVVRPRGWHLDEAHVRVDGERMSASLFDAGLFIWHNAKALLAAGSGPYLYLPKLEHHLEARLWNDVLSWMEKRLDLPADSVRVTVLIETLPAAFQMHEILWELRGRAAGLNAGRWDYLFSAIKTLGARPDAVLPDRGQVTMDVPFLRAYAELLVATCHQRGAHAMGGMSAFIPSRKDPEVNARALAKVREDKEREALGGFDGTWVAHPDLVPVAREVFDRNLGDRLNQIHRGAPAEPTEATAGHLLDLHITDGRITEDGLRHNLRVALIYLESWLRGTGAVAIDNLMEDAATAEIARSQVWQWLHHGVTTADGTHVTRDLVERILHEEATRGSEAWNAANASAQSPTSRAPTALEDAPADRPTPTRHRFGDAEELLRDAVLAADCPEFLTMPAYERLENPA